MVLLDSVRKFSGEDIFDKIGSFTMHILEREVFRPCACAVLSSVLLLTRGVSKAG